MSNISNLTIRSERSRNRAAILDEQVVGHIAFSPVVIQSDEEQFPAIGLAPMSVLPEYQNPGIGFKLGKAGLDIGILSSQCMKIL